jgi:putative two-component system response regulator
MKHQNRRKTHTIPKLLLVDDAPDSIKVLMEALEHFNYEILVATSGKIALEVASSQKTDLILLDVLMPFITGYEVCTKLKANAITKDIPVIFITARNDDENETKGFELGAVDYITKPINPSIVQARVKTHLKLRFAYQELERQNTVLEATALYLAHHLEKDHLLYSEKHSDMPWEEEEFSGKKWCWTDKAERDGDD